MFDPGGVLNAAPNPFSRTVASTLADLGSLVGIDPVAPPLAAPDAAAKIRVFVSLTTIPPRIDGLGRCLASLLAQTHPPERIFVNVPRAYRRFGRLDMVPAWLADGDERIQLVRCERDHGPATKFLGALDRVPRTPDTLMVIVDDDVAYRDYMLSTFARAHAADPRRAHSFFTFRYRGVTVGQGVDGIAVPAEALDGIVDFWARIAHDKDAFFVDDLWLSYYLQRAGYPVASLARHRPDRDPVYTIYNDAGALLGLTGAHRRWKAMAGARRALRAAFGA
ncbi:glycosyltransferase [Nitratireductor alexandrii]|uniref:glycosyltransferase n=1 Tax=Nitratireductor alexandrii TaxID=2448161 RepID=UPI0013DF6770|nr:glycosyltransferase [Nitratireductor alexandrii]